MEFLLFDRLEDSDYLAQVYGLLKKCQHEFVPPLSQRVSTTQHDLCGSDPLDAAEPKAYFQQLLTQPIILVMQQGQLLGFMSFLRQHVCQEVGDQISTIYVTTVIVDPQHRGNGLTLQMYQKLMGIARTCEGAISTRTWSTNNAHIKVLSQLGFCESLRIRDGRGPGIDTVYFRKDEICP